MRNDVAPKVAAKLLQDLDVADLTIEDPPIEDVIESVFAGASATPDPERTDEAEPADKEQREAAPA